MSEKTEAQKLPIHELGKESSAPRCSAPEFTVTGPCGHTVDFSDAMVRVDDFICPVCDLWWGVDQEPPIVLDSGFSMPGKRTVVIRGTKLDRMRKQAAASRQWTEDHPECPACGHHMELVRPGKH